MARSFKASLTAAGMLALVGTIMIAVAARDASAFAVYASFTGAFLVWGYHEMSFLMGKLTGPRRTPCPPEARGWTRFVLSAQTVIYHELALAVTLGLLTALTWGQANVTGVLAFAVLFAMRLSTKLNIFLGVPNFSQRNPAAAAGVSQKLFPHGTFQHVDAGLAAARQRSDMVAGQQRAERKRRCRDHVVFAHGSRTAWRGRASVPGFCRLVTRHSGVGQCPTQNAYKTEGFYGLRGTVHRATGRSA